MMPRRPVNVHGAYHAHIYFGPQTVGQARAGERSEKRARRCMEAGYTCGGSGAAECR